MYDRAVVERRRSSIGGLLAVVATLGAAGLASGAGSPVASAASPGSMHTYWAALAETTERPTLIKLGFEPNTDRRFAPTFVMLGTGYVSQGFPAISWDNWGGETASGTGVARLGGQDSAGPLESQSQPVNVDLTLAGRSSCGAVDIYTSLSVALAPGSSPPADWSFARAERGEHHQCWPVDGCPEAESTCTVLDDTVSDHPYPSTADGRAIIEPEPFGPRHWLYRMHFHRWGSPVAVGEGLLVSPDAMAGCGSKAASCEQAHVYAARYTLSDPRWCVARAFHGPRGSASVSTGLNYTVAKVEAFGSGSPLRGSSLAVPGAGYERLLGQIEQTASRRYTAQSSLLDPTKRTSSPVKTSCLAE